MRRVGQMIGLAVLAGSILMSLVGCFGEPKASIDAIPTWGLPPLEVAFEGRSMGGSSSIIDWSWDFDDGASAQGMTVAHTYTEAGSYVVDLVITDSGGHVDTSSLRIVVLQLPLAQFDYECGASPANALTVSFDGTSSTPFIPNTLLGFSLQGGARTQKINDFHWDFGDGTSGTGSGQQGWLVGEPVKHTYAQPGSYDVTLTVTCNYGYTNQIEHTVVVGENDEPDLVGDFAIVSTFWEVDDEEEEAACVTIWGSVASNALTAAGCELTATAYDAFENPVGTATSWPSANANIASGGTVPYNLLICTLSVPAQDVEDVVVEVTDVAVWP